MGCSSSKSDSPDRPVQCADDLTTTSTTPLPPTSLKAGQVYCLWVSWTIMTCASIMEPPPASLTSTTKHQPIHHLTSWLWQVSRNRLEAGFLLQWHHPKHPDMNQKNIKDVFTFQWELKHRKSKAGVEGITASLTSLPLNVNCRTWSTFQAEAEEVFNVGDILNCRIRQLTSFPFPFIRWTWIQHEKEMAWSAPVFRCVETKPLRAPLFVYSEACWL